MGQGKFIIDGKIEGVAEPIVPKSLNKNRIAHLKAWILVLSIISFVFLALAFYLFVKNDSLSSEILSMKGKIKRVDEILAEKNAMEYHKDSLQRKLKSIQTEKGNIEQSEDLNDGVFFEVQIGNIKNFNLDAYEKEMVILHQDKSQNGTKFCLGRFRSFDDAMAFEEEIKKIGLKSAFLVGRINGKLVDYEEAVAKIQVDPK